MDLNSFFQTLLTDVPVLVQPLIVSLAAAVPFLEGEVAVMLGIITGINPVLATIAAILGNFACVTVLVLAGAGARQAIVGRVQARKVALAGGVDVTEAPAAESGRGAARRAKFQRAFERYGVPGVSLLGPLLLPTQFTATMLAAAGIGKGRILIWQGVAITLWTTFVAVVIGLTYHAIN